MSTNTGAAPPSAASSSQQVPGADSVPGGVAAVGIGMQQSKPVNGEHQQPRDVAHGWEAVDGSSLWQDVREDDDGNLLTGRSHFSLAAQIRQRRRRLASTDLARSSRRLVRHMLRHCYLVIDCSRWSREKDPALPPARTRLETTLGLASDFVSEFYDQNPLGHLGVVLCRDGEAEMLTGLGGSPRKHQLALGAALATELGKKGGPDLGGEFSLKNGVEVAGRSLGFAPRYGSREIVVVTSALATIDPGDILVETLPRLLQAGVRVSTVALQAEVHVCKRLAEATGGLAGVCLNMGHLRDLVMGHAIPPPVRSADNDGVETNTEDPDNCWPEITCEFVEMGFPSREGGDVPTLVHCSGGGTSGDRSGDGAVTLAINPATADDRRSNRLITFARTGYICPRCRSRCSDLPSDCAVCSLRLILAPHLARTFHHLFPVSPFEELEEGEVIGSADGVNGKESETNNGVKTNGNRGLTAPPILSSSEFMPPSSNSSSNIDTFMVTSSAYSVDEKRPDLESSATSTSKMINVGPSLVANSSDSDRCCFGCLKIIGCRPLATTNKSNRESAGEDREAILRFQCPECHNIFCPDCDAFLHETLHNCPGCLC